MSGVKFDNGGLAAHLLHQTGLAAPTQSNNPFGHQGLGNNNPLASLGKNHVESAMNLPPRTLDVLSPERQAMIGTQVDMEHQNFLANTLQSRIGTAYNAANTLTGNAAQYDLALINQMKNWAKTNAGAISDIGTKPQG